MTHTLDSGDTAWMLVAAALVLLMAPGLALFYGGMVRSKSVLNMMMMTFGALAVVLVIWTLVGYSIAFGDDVGGGLLGDPRQFAGLGQLIGVEANGIERLPVLSGVEALWIAVDHDDAGLRASRAAAKRWADAGAEAFLVTPRAARSDLNDIIGGASNGRA